MKTSDRSPAEFAVRWGLPLAALVFFIVTARGYGIFRDELYYLACGHHLGWGYVDQPPVVGLLAALANRLFGHSLVGMRAFPAVALAATVLLAGDTARVLGGGRWARIVTQLLVVTSPVYLALFTIFSMNAFDVLIWAGLTRIGAALLRGADPRYWLGFGALAGVGLENKFDVGLLGVGIGVGLLLARRFDHLRSRWLWIGGGLAAVLFLPHILWQAANGWPTREFVANAQAGKITALGPIGFLAGQILQVGPVAALVALVGLGWLLIAESGRAWRPLGWAVLVVTAVFAFSISKAYYLAPVYVVLFPAAAVALERWTAPWKRVRAVRAVVTVLIVLVWILAPLAKPLVSEEGYIRYSAALGIAPDVGENHRLGRLPQFFADMHGWRSMAEEVAAVYHALPAADQARACFYGDNYAEAGAIEYFEADFDLPPAISGHNSYWLWGPGECTGDVLLLIGGTKESHQEHFESIEAGGEFHCDYCMPYENDQTIWVARGLNEPIAAIWPRVKNFN